MKSKILIALGILFLVVCGCLSHTLLENFRGRGRRGGGGRGGGGRRGCCWRRPGWFRSAARPPARSAGSPPPKRGADRRRKPVARAAPARWPRRSLRARGPQQGRTTRAFAASARRRATSIGRSEWSRAHRSAPGELGGG